MNFLFAIIIFFLILIGGLMIAKYILENHGSCSLSVDTISFCVFFLSLASLYATVPMAIQNYKNIPYYQKPTREYIVSNESLDDLYYTGFSIRFYDKEGNPIEEEYNDFSKIDTDGAARVEVYTRPDSGIFWLWTKGHQKVVLYMPHD